MLFRPTSIIRSKRLNGDILDLSPSPETLSQKKVINLASVFSYLYLGLIVLFTSVLTAPSTRGRCHDLHRLWRIFVV